MLWVAAGEREAVLHKLQAAGPGFLQLAPCGVLATLGFAAGFAAAALGFGLGQPHIVSRYLAGASPEETRAAWWIYIGFVQYTWISMTVFGVVLRGLMPHLPEPEAGLSTFFQARTSAVATGVIVADVFATIAATSNSLLVAMAQSLTHDLAPRLGLRLPLGMACVLLGAATMLLSLLCGGSVMSLALSSVSLIAAGIAPAVIAKVLHWRHDSRSLIVSVVAGIGAAATWKLLGLSTAVNEAAAGLAAGLLAIRLAAPARDSETCIPGLLRKQT